MTKAQFLREITPAESAQLLDAANKYFNPRERAVWVALRPILDRRRLCQAAFIAGMQAAMAYQKHPPRAVLRVADRIEARVRRAKVR